MAQERHPHSQEASAESLMADFLSAEQLHRMAEHHDVEAIHAKEDERTKREQEKRRRIDMLRERRELTPDVIQRALQRWQAAAQQGSHEIEVFRFPSELCSDDGRAINSGEADWGRTLVGVPAQIYEIWSEYLRPRGYRLKAYIVDFPEGKPGDVGMFISWG